MKKRILSIILTVALLLTVTPLSAVAEDCIHEYNSVCDADCNLCGEETRPEADHQRNDRPACSESANCVLCGIDFPPHDPPHR